MKNQYHAIGLMSGTSLDGLDICYVRFIFDEILNSWSFHILQKNTISYQDKWFSKLEQAYLLNTADLLELNIDFGFFLGDCVNEFILKNNIDKDNIKIIASHGHTILHQPEKKFTLQIGDGRAIYLKTKLSTIYDFRSLDVMLGGNGAPLVPIGDHYLFKEYDACINLGGFSNISLERNNKRIAFDICPVNVILNKYAKKLGFNFDNGGKIAKKGKTNLEILTKLNNLSYYQKKPPKSLGIEWVHHEISPLLKVQKPEDILATWIEHASDQIANTLNEYEVQTAIFTGGGTFNTYLIEKIKQKTTCCITIPSEDIINYKEALIFAFMGILKYLDKPNVLSSATGSERDHSAGILVSKI